MRHLKLFESFEDIDSICDRYGITNYTINDNGTVDVDGSVNLYLSAPANDYSGLTKLPLRFGIVNGFFDCSDNKLTTLEGSPDQVNGDFYCSNNQLATLEGAPSYVGGSFNCYNNQLTKLEGCPDHVGGYFDCNNNQLISLEGCIDHVDGYFYCEDNPIYSIYKLFPNYKAFRDSLDYNYLRGTDIVRSRFEEACEEAGIRMPKKINGYNWI